MTDVSRRNFLKLVTAAIATPILPSEVVDPNIVAETDFGFTFGPVVTAPQYCSFDEIIRETLRTRAKQVADNVSINNAVFLRLKENDYIKINKISADEQTQRMIDRINKKRKKFDHDLRYDQFNTVEKIRGRGREDYKIFHESYESIENIVARQES